MPENIQKEIKSKYIFVIGPESTGSQLIAKIIAHNLGVPFGSWDAIGWCEVKDGYVIHRSLPFERPERYPDVTNWIKTYGEENDIYFILTTRDIIISEFSRRKRWKSKTKRQLIKESDKARSIMLNVVYSEVPYLIWNYETFMYIGKEYFIEIAKMLDLTDWTIPILLRNANKNRIRQMIESQEKL